MTPAAAAKRIATVDELRALAAFFASEAAASITGTAWQFQHSSELQSLPERGMIPALLTGD
jgi:hypothetical protein